MKLGLGLGYVSPDTDWTSEPEIQGSVLSPSNAAFCRQLGITHIIGSGESRTPTGSAWRRGLAFLFHWGGYLSVTRLPLPTAAPTATHPLRASRLTPPHPTPAQPPTHRGPAGGPTGFPGQPADDGYWRYEDLLAYRHMVEGYGLTLEAIENFPPAHCYSDTFSICALSVSLTRRVSLFQGTRFCWGRTAARSRWRT